MARITASLTLSAILAQLFAPVALGHSLGGPDAVERIQERAQEKANRAARVAALSEFWESFKADAHRAYFETEGSEADRIEALTTEAVAALEEENAKINLAGVAQSRADIVHIIAQDLLALAPVQGPGPHRTPPVDEQRLQQEVRFHLNLMLILASWAAGVQGRGRAADRWFFTTLFSPLVAGGAVPGSIALYSGMDLLPSALVAGVGFFLSIFIAIPISMNSNAPKSWNRTQTTKAYAQVLAQLESTLNEVLAQPVPTAAMEALKGGDHTPLERHVIATVCAGNLKAPATEAAPTIIENPALLADAALPRSADAAPSASKGETPGKQRLTLKIRR